MQPNLTTARKLARLLDAQFNILGLRFGFDTLIGLVPGIGDAIGLVSSSYLLWLGFSLRLPKAKLVRMGLNIVIDTAMGLVPVVGDLGDLFFKANLKNLRLIEAHLVSQVAEDKNDTGHR